ncbi:MAG: TadE/TadG family type IV pilus assembly protein [Pseudomonadota bacterium]
MLIGLRNMLIRFSRDRDGASAVEFALIAPFLITLYLGAVQVSQALNADSKLTSAANAVGDLVAQDDVITDNELDDIFEAAGIIMEPYDVDAMVMRVSSVRMDNDGDIFVDWSDAQGIDPLGDDAQPVIPNGILVEGESIVLVEAGYNFTTPFKVEGFESLTLSDTVYLRPRRGLWVRRD